MVVVPTVEAASGPRRAVAGDGVFAAILRAMRSGTAGGAFRGEAFGSPWSVGDGEVAIDVDQSNESVIVGGSAVVKLFPITAPGPQPGLDLPVHLASVGFTALPAPLGALRWTSPEGDDVVLRNYEGNTYRYPDPVAVAMTNDEARMTKEARMS